MKYLWVIFLLLAQPLMATETKPWFGNVMEFEFRPTYSFRHFSEVDVSQGPSAYTSDDSLLNLSLALTPVSQWNGEVEMLVARTAEQGFSIAHLKATARYLWCDDIIGDPFSLTTGLSLTVPVKTSQQDISMGYHGDVEAELHAALGREMTRCDSWIARGWLVGGGGIANIGSPWLFFDANIEGNYCDRHHLRFFITGRFGVGDDNLDITQDPFVGYSDINHHSIDTGFRYTYLMDYCGVFYLEYSHRIMAKNYPEDVATYTIGYMLPFSL